MGWLILRRVLVAVPVLIGVSVAVFLALHVLPSDPTAVLLEGVPATPDVIRALQEQLGLNDPLPVQYWDFVSSALRGDFGTSFTTQQSVTSMIGSQMGATLQLTITAVGLTAFLGIALGVLAAIFRDTWFDSVVRVVSLLGTAMPIFWSGTLLMLVFSFSLHLFPASGSTGFKTLVLPSIALAFLASGLLIRLVRNSMIEVLGENFVTALDAKGLSPWRITAGHVLRNALIPAVTVIGLQIGGLLSGAVVTEVVFARQGLGRLLITGIKEQDYPVIQGTVLVISVIYLMVNIVVDISYAFIDPRIRTALEQAT
ncbi:MAG TPA: ABC transporter permease [Marmoricola sp.]|jgi:ABC-type dipeptide/oligopeptide/nickel transport system permease component|nr:ABC transporter permease [Marmoricola sp.]